MILYHMIVPGTVLYIIHGTKYECGTYDIFSFSFKMQKMPCATSHEVVTRARATARGGTMVVCTRYACVIPGSGTMLPLPGMIFLYI